MISPHFGGQAYLLFMRQNNVINWPHCHVDLRNFCDIVKITEGALIYVLTGEVSTLLNKIPIILRKYTKKTLKC